MKKLYTLLIALSIVFSSFAQRTDTQLTTSANTIKNETTAGANTDTRIGNMFLDIINSKQSILSTYNASGTNSYTVTVNSAVTSYLTGDLFFVKFSNANTTS